MGGGLITCAWVALGGAIGSVARYLLSNLAIIWLGEGFPWGTLAINIVGSLVIGFFATATLPGALWAVTSDARLFVMVGLCGGFTTFSAFSLQTMNLVHNGQIARAGLNIGASVALCLAAVWLGYVLAVAINGMKPG
jgi:CrcB protein